MSFEDPGFGSKSAHLSRELAVVPLRRAQVQRNQSFRAALQPDQRAGSREEGMQVRPLLLEVHVDQAKVAFQLGTPSARPGVPEMDESEVEGTQRPAARKHRGRDLLMDAVSPPDVGALSEETHMPYMQHRTAIGARANYVHEVPNVLVGQGLEHSLETGARRRRKPVVCVHPKNPVASCVTHGLVSGRGKVIAPGEVVDPGSPSGCDFAGIVGGAGVHDDDFVCEPSDRLETVPEVRGLVSYDHAEGDRHGGEGNHVERGDPPCKCVRWTAGLDERSALTDPPAATGGSVWSSPNKPEVTVVIPCCRQAHFLGDAVGSVVGQSFTDWEIVVVSGCHESAEAARRIVDRSRDGRIRVVEDAGRGVADARNRGIEQARSDVILPLDADDVLAPRFLETTLDAMGRTGRDSIVSTGLQEFGERRGVWDLPLYSANELLESNCLCVASLFTKGMWRAAGGYDVGLPIGYEDWSFWIACSKHEPRVVQLPERLLLYRVHDTSNTSHTLEYDLVMRAMIWVAHSDRYSDAHVLLAHAAITSMPDGALELVERRLKHFAHPNLHFFRGLALEARGDDAGARADYSVALERSGQGHWQAALRLVPLARSDAERAACQAIIEAERPSINS
jgi:hypothetical protein